MKQAIKREETPLYAVAQAAAPRRANGSVVKEGGVPRIKKHVPYARRGLTAAPLVYKLPVAGYR